MDATQLLLSAAVTITTVLLIFVGLQLISLLRHYKASFVNTSEAKKTENPLRQLADGEKKDKIVKKKVNLASLLGRIKILTPRDQSAKEKFFKSR